MHVGMMKLGTSARCATNQGRPLLGPQRGGSKLLETDDTSNQPNAWLSIGDPADPDLDVK
jgi:hypothetical protein